MASFGLGYGLTSCTNEEVADFGKEVDGHDVMLTVAIDKGDFNSETRVSYQEDTYGDLSCFWEENDQIIVSDITGTVKGIMRIVPGTFQEKMTRAEFTGKLIGLSDGKTKLNFSYLGTDYNDYNTDTNKPPKSVTLDYTTQVGTRTSLAKKDLFFSYVSDLQTKSGIEVSIDGDNAYAPDMKLERMMTFAHFDLQFPAGVKRTNEIVKVTPSKTFTPSMDFSYSVPFGWSESGSGDFISVTGGDDLDKDGSLNDIYMTLCVDGQNNRYGLTFSVEIGGKTYTGELAERTTDFVRNQFLSAGKNKGIPVTMEADEPSVDHNKNPLAKWAEYNLQYNKSTGKSSFVANAKDKGYLYQWGRNVGFTNANDALGSKNTSTESYGYYITNANTFVHAGIDSPYLDSEGYICLYGPTGELTAASDLEKSDVKTKWVMNANTSSSSTYRGDYYTWANGGSTWKDRAEKQGYKMSDLIPDENVWRLPTSTDFAEIMPLTSINGSSSLSTYLSNKGTEIRNKDDITYAIKWSKDGYNLRIDALVIPEGTTKSNVNWSDKNVVTRWFPLAGVIRSTVYQVNNYINNRTIDYYLDIIARPTPLCDLGPTDNYKVFTDYSGWNVAYTYVQYGIYTPLNDNSDSYGAYWVSDSKSTFTIVDNSTWKYAEGATASQTSQLQVISQNAHNGYSIRLIKK